MPRFALACAMALALAPAAIAAPKDTPREEQLYNYGSQTPSSALDVTNPMSVMNMLRNMNTGADATPPGDAIDAALQEFNNSPGSAAPSKLVPVTP